MTPAQIAVLRSVPIRSVQAHLRHGTFVEEVGSRLRSLARNDREYNLMLQWAQEHPASLDEVVHMATEGDRPWRRR